MLPQERHSPPPAHVMLRRLAIALLALGAALVAFSVAWLVAVSPGYSLLPLDFQRTEALEGTYTVLDPSTGATEASPMEEHREWKAVGRSVHGEIVVLQETVTTTVSIPGSGPQARTHTSRLLVHRRSRNYLVEGDTRRQGQFPAPVGLGTEDTFPVWVAEVGWPLQVRYGGSEAVGRLKVLRFAGEVSDLPLPTEPSGIVQHAADVAVELLVEPRTGYVVSRAEHITLKVMDGKLPVRTQSVTDLRFSEDEVSRLARLARGERLRVALLGTFMPWAVLGLGALLSAEGLFLLLVASWRRRTSRGTSETGSRT
ncbi:MAG: porin PorA family protein [Chloroflexota bacterium]|nr:porin PorA family protein [Chloroflexota bacterium]